MKKKFVLFALIIAIVSVICSLGAVSAFADEEPASPAPTYDYTVTVSGSDTITKGASATYTITLKKGDNVVSGQYVNEDDDVVNYIYRATLTKGGNAVETAEALTVSGNTVTVNTAKLSAGDYALSVTAYKGTTQVSAKSTALAVTVAKAKANYTTWIFLAVAALLIVGIFVYSSRSNKKRQRQAQSVADSLALGDKVKTIGGVCGVVVEINHDENTFVLESGTEGHKTYTKFDKAAVYQTAKPNQSFEQAAQERANAPVKEKHSHSKKDDKTTDENVTEENVTEEKTAEETPVENAPAEETKPEADGKDKE